MLVTSQALMVMSVHRDAGTAGNYRMKACFLYHNCDLNPGLGIPMTQPRLTSDVRFECLEVDQAGNQDSGQELLDLGVELDQLGDKTLEQVGKQPLAQEAEEV